MMSQLVVGPPGYRLVLDACCTCRAVWFDRQEIDAVPHEPPPAADEEPLAPKIREKLAIAEVEIENQMRREAVQEGGGPPEGWMWVPVLLGLPAKTDAPDVRRAPWCTWIASGLMVVFMVGTLGNIKALVHDWGFVPVDWDRYGGLTFVSSFVLPLGVLPALVNLYALLIFGGNVEDDLGPALMGFLVISSHIGGLVLYAALCNGSEIPLAGATAGVSGVLVYYMVRFPWSRVGIIPWWLCRRWGLGARLYTEMPAFVGLLVFIVVQWRLGLHPALVYQHAVLASHLGGLAIGLIFGWAMRWARAVGVQRR
jgi:membrane associated rhomboid family serine protease